MSNEHNDEPSSRQPDGNDDGLAIYNFAPDEGYKCAHGTLIPRDKRGALMLPRSVCPQCKQDDADNWKRIHD